jgi:hypothetical protein
MLNSQSKTDTDLMLKQSHSCGTHDIHDHNQPEITLCSWRKWTSNTHTTHNCNSSCTIALQSQLRATTTAIPDVTLNHINQRQQSSYHGRLHCYTEHKQSIDTGIGRKSDRISQQLSTAIYKTGTHLGCRQQRAMWLNTLTKLTWK